MNTQPSSAESPDPLGRLPSGRHHLSREHVERSQRARLLLAMLRAAGEQGYADTTVGDVVARAAVSRSTFYAQFTDKQACFIAAFQFGIEHMLERMQSASVAGAVDAWRELARSDVVTYLDALTEEPAFALSLHVEVLAAGRAALERRAEMLGRFALRTAQLHELARQQEPSLPELPPEVFALYTGGFDELIRDTLRTQPPAALPALAKPVLTATYALFTGGRS